MEANNYAALYKALIEISDICDGADTGGLDERSAIYNIAQTALYFAPLRNCDVGTEKEQYVRFRDYCYSKRCVNMITQNTLGSEVAFAWAQMPYTEGATK